MNVILFEKDSEISKKTFYEEEGMTKKSAQHYYLQCIELFDQTKLICKIRHLPFHPSKMGLYWPEVFLKGWNGCISAFVQEQFLSNRPLVIFSFYEQMTNLLKERRDSNLLHPRASRN